MQAFINHRRLIIIAQSISCIFLVKFAALSRKLLHTFDFNKLAWYDVTVPGNDSKITWKLPTNLPNIHTNFKLHSCSGTVFS